MNIMKETRAEKDDMNRLVPGRGRRIKRKKETRYHSTGDETDGGTETFYGNTTLERTPNQTVHPSAPPPIKKKRMSEQKINKKINQRNEN